MNLYKISINNTDNYDYNFFDGAVVRAETEEIARRMDPKTGECFSAQGWQENNWWVSSPEDVKVEFLATCDADELQEVVLSSYNRA